MVHPKQYSSVLAKVYAITNNWEALSTMKITSKISIAIRKAVSCLTKNWKEVVVRVIPAVFPVMVVLAFMHFVDYQLAMFPAFITELCIALDFPRYMHAICFTIALAGFMLPCMDIAMGNASNANPWIIIVVSSVDIVGLICSLWIDLISIPRQRILVLILMELLLVASQIINVMQKKKQNASKHDALK